MVEASPTISGETPIDDPFASLKIKGITTRGELLPFEAENVRKATVKYLARKPSRKKAPFDLTWLKRLHNEMFEDVWTWAGLFRKNSVNIGVHYSKIEEAVYTLLGNLPVWEENKVDLIEQAALLHHKAVFIHPFLNGNGRWSRLLANIWLKQHGASPTMWPEDAVGAVSTIRSEYLDAVQAADDGDYSALTGLHRRYRLKKR